MKTKTNSETLVLLSKFLWEENPADGIGVARVA